MKTSLRDSLNTKKTQYSNRILTPTSSSTTNSRASSTKINYSKRGISNDNRENSSGYISSKYNMKSNEPPSGPDSKITITIINRPIKELNLPTRKTEYRYE